MNDWNRRLADPRPIMMGVLNVTPDSFSDGGHFTEPATATMHALSMVGEGADIIDVGGESTRPGAPRVDAAEQIRRTRGVVEHLRQTLPDHVQISIDTTLPVVAEAALAAGATMINDVQAGLETGMLELAARSGAPIVLMHMRGTPATMQQDPVYADVVAEVEAFLLARAATALELGVGKAQIILDPGIGFGKTRAHNLALLARLRRLSGHGYPLLLGTSRKRFMGSICAETDPNNLLGATCATTALGVAAGVRIFRVHDVKPNRQAADVAWTIGGAGDGP